VAKKDKDDKDKPYHDEGGKGLGGCMNTGIGLLLLLVLLIIWVAGATLPIWLLLR
jgi:hypothetical protein